MGPRDGSTHIGRPCYLGALREGVEYNLLLLLIHKTLFDGDGSVEEAVADVCGFAASQLPELEFLVGGCLVIVFSTWRHG